MASCEKCWGDAFMRAVLDVSKSQSEHYMDILRERENNQCSPEEQAGQFWDEETKSDNRNK